MRASDEPAPDDELVAALRAELGPWYARHRRDLPWRRTRDPYAIWISEAMLQQTRVETVVPYWERFLERFPTVAALAAADEDDLLAAWSGLGYYRRARALREAARVVRDRFGGAFPRALGDALSLPGVGPYTAGAVLSIAFDEAQPLVDGNVLRVFSRIFALDDPVGSGELDRRAWGLARRLVPQPGDSPGPGDWNQALMELGATVCTAREPRCLTCPVRGSCRAVELGLVGDLPRPRPKPAPIDVELEVLLVTRGGEVLLQRRSRNGRMAGMWELPTRELPDGEAEPRLWAADFLVPAPGASLDAGVEITRLRHGITRHRIQASLRSGSVLGPGPVAHEALRWHSLGEAAGLALTGMTKKVLQHASVRGLLADSTSPAGGA